MMKILGLLACTLLGITPTFADPAAEGRAHSEAFARAMDARDIKAVLALYADDARVIWPGQGEEAKGKVEIEKLIANTLAQFPKDSRLKLKSQDAILLADDYIVTISRWEQSYTGDDGTPRTAEVRATEIIKRVGRGALYVVDHASFGRPAADWPTTQQAPK